MLAERLKELEAEGIVVRTVIPTTPVRIEYRLSEKGAALGGAVEALSTWAETWSTPDTRANCPASAHCSRSLRVEIARSAAG